MNLYMSLNTRVFVVVPLLASVFRLFSARRQKDTQTARPARRRRRERAARSSRYRSSAVRLDHNLRSFRVFNLQLFQDPFDVVLRVVVFRPAFFFFAFCSVFRSVFAWPDSFVEETFPSFLSCFCACRDLRPSLVRWREERTVRSNRLFRVWRRRRR